MGLGGHLIWTAVLKNVRSHTQIPLSVGYTPKLSDWIRGSAYDRSRSLAPDPIFLNNPNLLPLPPENERIVKGPLDRRLDWIGDRLILPVLHRLGVAAALIDRAYRRAQNQKAGAPIIWMDQLEHSYAESETPERMVWRKGPNIISVVTESILRRLASFGVGHHPEGLPSQLRGHLLARDAASTHPQDCELYFSDAEVHVLETKFRDLLAEPFVTFEPDSNPEYFGELRRWPEARWVEALTTLSARAPGLRWVQLGVGSAAPYRALARVQSLAGQTTFREAAWLMGRSKLFIGTEGGLIHAANAVRVPTLALWGGVTRPAYAGYPDRHQILHHPPECAEAVGCGRKGQCPFQIRCMTDITVAEVVNAAESMLSL
jgi:hypothetical protein